MDNASRIAAEQREHHLRSGKSSSSSENKGGGYNTIMTRGLERMIHPEHSYGNRQRAYNAVLKERNGGVSDPTSDHDTVVVVDLEMYMKISHECLCEAMRTADMDAKFVNQFRRDCSRNRNRDTTPSGGSSHQRSSIPIRESRVEWSRTKRTPERQRRQSGTSRNRSNSLPVSESSSIAGQPHQRQPQPQRKPRQSQPPSVQRHTNNPPKRHFSAPSPMKARQQPPPPKRTSHCAPIQRSSIQQRVPIPKPPPSTPCKSPKTPSNGHKQVQVSPMMAATQQRKKGNQSSSSSASAGTSSPSTSQGAAVGRRRQRPPPSKQTTFLPSSWSKKKSPLL